MAQDSQDNRLASLMNERRLDLGLRWDDVAKRAGMSSEGLRALRRDRSEPRELTQRGLERALCWQKGSIRQILDGGEPVPVLPAGPANPDPGEMTPECDFERFLAAKGIEPRLLLEQFRAHRELGHTDACLPPARPESTAKGALEHLVRRRA